MTQTTDAPGEVVLDPVHELDEDAPWLTAVIRPTGVLRRRDAERLHHVLDPLSTVASVVVLDLDAARLAGPGAAAAIDGAAARLEERGGALLCVNTDEHNRARLAEAGAHAVVADAGRTAVHGPAGYLSPSSRITA
ncbi:hypothetical protein [Georgenia alba]|uniref:STAS domain-containing protein n=1 Tax=Georgenia alba TaxID=2233858 RepID=A0ABW2Q7J5_9MICO